MKQAKVTGRIMLAKNTCSTVTGSWKLKVRQDCLKVISCPSTKSSGIGYTISDLTTPVGRNPLHPKKSAGIEIRQA